MLDMLTLLAANAIDVDTGVLISHAVFFVQATTTNARHASSQRPVLKVASFKLI